MLEKTLSKPADLSDRYAGPSSFDALDDVQLLDCFVRRREQAAFAALVRRHGPMVLGVCQRVLRHNEDAEDAFQATFLVLANKAHRLRKPQLLGNWLYGVAYRTALHARQRAARRGAREREAASMSAPTNEPDNDASEIRRVVEEELQRLPEKYRAPLVLCYLQGKTNEEAARILGWPVGSMSYRLARGRELLGERLQGRLALLSFLLSPALLAEWLHPQTVPPLLAEATVQAATTLVSMKMAATAVLSPSVRELMEAILRSLSPPRWRWLLAALLLALTLLGVGVAAYAASSESAPSHSCPSASPP